MKIVSLFQDDLSDLPVYFVHSLASCLAVFEQKAHTIDDDGQQHLLGLHVQDTLIHHGYQGLDHPGLGQQLLEFRGLVHLEHLGDHGHTFDQGRQAHGLLPGQGGQNLLVLLNQNLKKGKRFLRSDIKIFLHK